MKDIELMRGVQRRATKFININRRNFLEQIEEALLDNCGNKKVARFDRLFKMCKGMDN